ncbi:unnamed protein product [Fusarium venenatum]|uniref:Apple domain-containing protein n=2 Tax=Fusarium venenatum TaxID=56646 RepID=A0A2L2TDR3_9HYPO|nr:uncharacterized protein FVRRES_08305 [Fusarium venenatum]CEI68228.1 unnamed protein product [Fusarium venenatum]
MGTAQVTKHVTRHFTTTVTATVYTTSTQDITSTSTMQLTEEAPTTITVTRTEDAATTTVSFEYTCGARGIWKSEGIAQQILLFNRFSFSSCKEFCSTKLGALSFVYSNSMPQAYSMCLCFGVLSYVNMNRGSNSQFIFFDMACPAETKPLKRVAQVNKRIPAYIPLKGASDVSRACSCHITNKPAAPATSVVKALKFKAVTVTSHTKVYNKRRKYITTTFRRSVGLTYFKTTTKTGYNTVTVTDRHSATITQPATITVTHVKTVTVTNVLSVHVTNHNTIYTTNIKTALETDLQTEIVTEVDYYTVSEYDTIPVTITKAEVIEPPLVTVHVATTTIYG